jgi:hypothetical protein
MSLMVSMSSDLELARIDVPSLDVLVASELTKVLRREREGEGGTKTSAMRLDDGKSRQEMESRKERRSSC